MPNQEPLYARFGADLKQARLIANMSVTELARAADCSDKNIRNLENGIQRPHPKTVKALADALNVTPEHLTRSIVRPGLDEMLSEPELRRLAELLAPLIRDSLQRDS